MLLFSAQPVKSLELIQPDEPRKTGNLVARADQLSKRKWARANRRYLPWFSGRKPRTCLPATHISLSAISCNSFSSCCR